MNTRHEPMVRALCAAMEPTVGHACAMEAARGIVQSMVLGEPAADAVTCIIANRRRTPAYGWPELTTDAAREMMARVRGVLDLHPIASLEAA